MGMRPETRLDISTMRVRVLGGMQIGAADAAGQCLDQDLARRGLGLGDIADDDVAGAEDRRLHLMNSAVVVRKSCSRS